MELSKMTLEEILALPAELSKRYLNEYLSYFYSWIDLGLSKNIVNQYYGKAIVEVDPVLWNYMEGLIVHYYPNIKEVKSKKEKFCAFCGETIHKQQLYYKYHPFIVKKEKRETSMEVLSHGDICVCPVCEKLLPKTYEGLLQLQMELELEHNTQDQEINYDMLKEQVGEVLDFKVLRKEMKNHTE